jgi:hypothetical protein
MELFVVRNNGGEVIRRNLKSKVEAKKVRKELHNEVGVDEKDIKNWKTEAKFLVSRGINHIRYNGRRAKNAYAS